MTGFIRAPLDARLEVLLLEEQLDVHMHLAKDPKEVVDGLDGLARALVLWEARVDVPSFMSLVVIGCV